MDLNSLSGTDLDKYGESMGISRYQGLGLPEDDDSYRESIRHNVTIHVHSDAHNADVVSKRVYYEDNDPIYGVLLMNIQTGKVVRLVLEDDNVTLAVYDSLNRAKDQAAIWNRRFESKVYAFVAQEVKLFSA